MVPVPLDLYPESHVTFTASPLLPVIELEVALFEFATCVAVQKEVHASELMVEVKVPGGHDQQRLSLR